MTWEQRGFEPDPVKSTTAFSKALLDEIADTGDLVATLKQGPYASRKGPRGVRLRLKARRRAALATTLQRNSWRKYFESLKTGKVRA